MQNVHKKVKDMFCDKCDKSFKSNLALDNHTKMYHLKALSYKCDICENSYPSKGKLSVHIQSNHSVTEMECTLCEKVFKSAETFNHHTKIIHEKYFLCSLCSKTFPSVREYRVHNESEQHRNIQMKLRKSKVSNDKIKYVCDSCKRMYLSKKHFKNHILKCSIMQQ